MRLLSLAALALVAGGCAPAVAILPPPPAGDIPTLQARLDERPGEVDTRVRLGAALQAAGRAEDAIATLQGSDALAAADPAAVLYLGLAYEDAGRFEEARTLYRRFLDTAAPGGDVERRLEGRIELLRRRELADAVRQALEREEQLAGTAPEEGTVAVFPFLYAGGDADLQPLGRAVAGLVATDLARLDRLRVVERVGVDVLLDELALSASGRVDPATAARGGRLLGAGHVVQASMGGTRTSLDVDAAVVEIATAEREVRTLEASASLDRIFDLEKEVLFDVVDALGLVLTAAERERLEERPTTNLMALLAYGQGLEAESEGRWGDAAGHFREAASLDPGFTSAAQAAGQAGAVAAAGGVSTAELVGQLRIPDLGPVLAELGALVGAAGIRDPAQELLGTEGTGAGSVTIEIILQPPGGG